VQISTFARRAAPLVLLAVVLAGCGGHGSSGSGAKPTPTPTQTPTPTPTPTATSSGTIRAIPDDFPLAQGLVAGGDTTVTSPRRDVKGIRLERVCWGGVWPGAAVDRMVVQQVAPEESVTRELVVYRDRAAAAAVGRQVRARAAQCHRLPATSDGDAMDVTLEGRAGADDGRTAGFAETLTGGQPGGSIFVFTQVGRAVLAVEDSGEWTRDSAVRGARSLVRADRGLVARLCVFSGAGC
jgi:hypothetical protein